MSLEAFEFFARLRESERYTYPCRMHWNGHCNAIEIAAAERSGLMEHSDIDRDDSWRP